MRFSSSRIATSRTLLPAKTETTSFVMFSPAVFGVSTTAGRLASCLTQPFPRVQKARHIPSKEFLGAWLRDVFMAIAADRTAELSLARRRHGAAVRRSRFVRRGRQTRATACPELGSESTHPRSHRLQGLRREKSSICRRPVTLPCNSLDAVGATRHRHRMLVAWQTAWRIDGTDSMLLIVAISSRNF